MAGAYRDRRRGRQHPRQRGQQPGRQSPLRAGGERARAGDHRPGRRRRRGLRGVRGAPPPGRPRGRPRTDGCAHHHRRPGPPPCPTRPSSPVAASTSTRWSVCWRASTRWRCWADARWAPPRARCRPRTSAGRTSPTGSTTWTCGGGGRPRSARQVLTALARILGTAPPTSGRPDALAAAADALRGQLDGRKILLVLDNVDRPDQVRPLLPPTARTCRLLLAGGPALVGLEGVVAHWIAEPGTSEAVELFATAGGAAPAARVRRADPRTDPAVRDIVDLCGRQPRTVRALGYRTAQHGWRHSDVLDALRRAVQTPPHQRLAVSPAARLVTERDIAYRALPRQARRLYRLMSLVPAPVDRPTIAALAGRHPELVTALLDRLAAAAFVVGAPGDRYEIRPLLAGSARLHLRDADPARARVAAQARLTRHLARRAERHAANLAVLGSPTGPGVVAAAGRRPVRLVRPAPGAAAGGGAGAGRREGDPAPPGPPVVVPAGRGAVRVAGVRRAARRVGAGLPHRAGHPDRRRPPGDRRVGAQRAGGAAPTPARPPGGGRRSHPRRSTSGAGGATPRRG